jgi:lysophospholipase L1-like esterase
MRIRLVTFSILVMLLGPALVHAVPQPTYYLALGDSLAIGVQPSLSGDVATNQGYADDLYSVFRTRFRGLTLAKLGCSGETTTSMIHGGICTYADGSQLAAAVNFLLTHRVAFVTLDIGGNDIDHCVSLAGIDGTCVTDAISTVGTDLPQILAELRSAAGPDTLIVGMNYYDPFLAAWRLGPSGQLLANASLLATTAFNGLLEKVYGAFDIPVADVADAYQINNPLPIFNLPLNVFIELIWTWIGAPAPFGPDIHPNGVGYVAIAGAFARKIEAP